MSHCHLTEKFLVKRLFWRAGPDRLKEALAALGLKSGGTLRQRAERLFLTRDTPLTQLDRKHFAKGAAPAAVRSAEENARISAAAQDTALLEAKVGIPVLTCLIYGGDVEGWWILKGV